MTCPACQAPVSKPASEGGVVVRSRYLRITAGGQLLLACPECGSELETIPKSTKLVLFRRKVSGKPSDSS